MQGIGGGGTDLGFGISSTSYSVSASSTVDQYGFGTRVTTISSSNVQSSSSSSKPAKGMKLGSKGVGGKGKNSMLDSLMAEENIAAMPISQGSVPVVVPQAVIPAAQVFPVSLVVEEKISVHLSREGSLEQMDVKGSLSLTSNTEEASKCKILLGSGKSLPGLAFQTHPKINKSAYDGSRVLALKESGKGFPVGRPVGVLRWSFSTTEDSMVPLSVNCWPEDEGNGSISVSLEYALIKLNMELHQVIISVPLGLNTQAPKVTSADLGSFSHDSVGGNIVWKVDLIDKSNMSGSLEFSVQGRNTDAFFPIQMSFNSSNTYASIDIAGVSPVDSQSIIPFGLISNLSTESYVCG